MRNFFIGKAIVTVVIASAVGIAYLPTAVSPNPVASSVSSSVVGNPPPPFTPNTTDENAVISLVENFYDQSPALFIALAIVGFPEIEILVILAIIVAAFLP